MKRIESIVIAIVLSFFFICFGTTTTLACWGGRPLAMGGAFVGVADSADAVYWNPAGLVIQEWGVHSSFITNWHDLNYDIYASLAFPTKKGAVGFAYVYNKDYLAKVILTYPSWWGPGDEHIGYICQDWQYFQLAYGRYLVKKWNLAIGVAGKFITSKFEIDIEDEEYYGKDETISDATTYDIDIGIYWAFGPDRGKNKKMFSLGCLFQDVLESSLEFKQAKPQQADDENGEDDDDTITQQFLMNIRPGIGFRPDKKTLFSLEIYDAGTEVYEQAQIRVGVERWFGSFEEGDKEETKIVIRAGAYHLNNKEDDKAYTGGIGWKFGGLLEISYTLMYWVEDNERSHLITMNLGP